MKKYKCELCKKDFLKKSLFPIKLLRSSFLDTIKNIQADISEDGYICPEDLKKIRSMHIDNLLKSQKGELSELDNIVLNSLKEHELISENVNKKFQKELTFGQKTADRVARFGGSWVFILIFFVFLLTWMGYNTFMLFHKPFDPYPYILLNLILSSLAAVQAPIIMMSQNRQAEKDRLQSDDDYVTNLKAELEIRQLHAKLDQFMKNGWDRLLEIQQIQIDLAEELLKSNNKKK